MTFTAYTIFCEDIREEKAGTDTLVGVLLDNIEVERVPASLTKLGLYTRIYFDPLGDDTDIGEVHLKLVLPDGSESAITSFGLEIIEHAKNAARQQDSPRVGLISKAVAAPFPLNSAGRIKFVVQTRTTEFISGYLNVKVKDSGVIGPTVSVPPA
jgi:hypothetical protein